MGFEKLTWLFTCNNKSRGIIRMNFDEAALLWMAVKRSAGPILEIGRAKGGSTLLLCAAATDRRIISIDIKNKLHPTVAKRLRQYENIDQLELITQDSAKGLPGETFGLIFFDGDHSSEGIKQDVQLYWPALKSFYGRRPLAIFHDAIPNKGLAHEKRLNYHSGIEQICKGVLNNRIAKYIRHAGSTILLEKRKELNYGIKVNNLI